MNAYNMKELSSSRRFWNEYIKVYRLKIIISILLIAVVAISSSFYPLTINWSFKLIEEGNAKYLFIVMLIVPFIALLRGLSNYLQILLVNKTALNIVGDLQKKIYEKIIHSNIEIIEDNGAGNLISRLSNDTTLILQALERLMNSLLKDGLTALVLLITMIYLDWKLAIVICLLLPVVALPIYKIGKKVNNISKGAQIQIGKFTNLLNQSFQNIQTIKSFQLENREIQNTNQEIEKRIFNLYKLTKYRAIMSPIIEVLAGIFIGLLLTFAGYQILEGNSTLGQLTAFITALLMISDPIRRISTLNSVYQEGLAAVERVYVLYSNCNIIEDKPDSLNFPVDYNLLKFENISFKYKADQRNVLNNITFAIKEGTRNYIIGESGAGKSTIFKLLIRLHEAKSGEIKFGDTEIQDIQIKSLRSCVSVVSQNTFIFNDTLKNNINLEKNDSSENIDFEKLMDDLNINNFADKLQNKYDTKIGIDGISLSGGELQRLAIARAIYKNAPLLLLDEATNSLDSINEIEINKTLDKYFKDKTVLIIAHKLETIKDADNIIVLKDGNMVGAGKYEDLKEENKYFQDLISSAF
ncbi:MAG: ABC transporter transmembrane domain-containing protein, partial [Pseudomonadota bacterium]|nr:ABC transporter transmembrane domain-containing protein [Pseudomonadota bacterium]